MNTDRNEMYDIPYLALECFKVVVKEERDIHAEMRVGDYVIYDEEILFSLIKLEERK